MMIYDELSALFGAKITSVQSAFHQSNQRTQNDSENIQQMNCHPKSRKDRKEAKNLEEQGTLTKTMFPLC